MSVLLHLVLTLNQFRRILKRYKIRNMKKIFLFVTTMSVLCLSACKTTTAVKTNTAPVASDSKKFTPRDMVQWEKDFVEYGKLKKGDTREFTYKYKNISKEDVTIEICTACDCTTLDWTIKTLKPGESGYVNAKFDSAKKDEEETINITIIFKNKDPFLGYPVVDEVKFHFDIIK